MVLFPSNFDPILKYLPARPMPPTFQSVDLCEAEFEPPFGVGPCPNCGMRSAQIDDSFAKFDRAKGLFLNWECGLVHPLDRSYHSHPVDDG
jgi:hypothetical protein